MIFRSCTSTSTMTIAFVEEPQSQNVAFGDIAEFRCRHPTADYIGWTVNGSSISNSNTTVNNVSTTSIPVPGGQSRYILLIGAIPTYSGAIVICIARFTSDCPSQNTGPAVLLIQGPLEAVSAIIRGYITDRTFSWNPPRSLDLSNAEPDIAYCVTIHHITCGRNDLLVSNCSVFNTYFMYEDISPGRVYRIEVIPRSNVEKATNGTPLSVDEKFIEYQVSRIYFVKELRVHNLTATVEFIPSKTIPGHRIIPDQYSVIMTTMDGFKEPSIISQGLEGARTNFNVTFILPIRRLWQYDLLAYDCRLHSLGSGMISSYELQISTTTPQPGEINVTGDFVDGSITKGALIIVYSLTNGPDSDSEVHYVLNRSNIQLVQALITGLNSSQYEVSVFMVEENGLPFSRVVDFPKLIKFNYSTKGRERPSHIITNEIEFKSQSNPTDVCITCTFLDSSATDCVAVVHQRISQLSSSGLMNIESSHKFTRSGDTASGCIGRVNMENYQIGVINGRASVDNMEGLKNPTDMTLIIIIVLCVVVVVFVVLLVCTLLVIIILCQKKLLCCAIASSPMEESDGNLTENKYVYTQVTDRNKNPQDSKCMSEENAPQGHTDNTNQARVYQETRRAPRVSRVGRGPEQLNVNLELTDQERNTDVVPFTALSSTIANDIQDTDTKIQVAQVEQDSNSQTSTL